MEHPFLANEIQPKPQNAKKCALQAARRAARYASHFAPLPPLPTIPGVEFLMPGSPKYDLYLAAANLRTTLRPALRAMCKTEQSVAAVLDWVRTNGLPFALRSGGHSYEGFSQSVNVVIDTRRIDGVTLDARRQTVTVGAGASLGAVYRALRGTGFAFAAGSCPTVGVAGHALGGGFGLLARAYGLTCDNLVSVKLVTTERGVLTTDKQQEPDLFWACRGGGGGSFGVATEFSFRVQRLSKVLIFRAEWMLPKDKAVGLFKAWQQWAPVTSNAITSIMKVESLLDGKLRLRCIGQSTSSDSALRRELNRLVTFERPSKALEIESLTFFDAVNHFAGSRNKIVGSWPYEVEYFKAKSDYIVQGLSDSGIQTLLEALKGAPAGQIVALCDAYGGAISEVPSNTSAFPHRDGHTFCIQYFSQWKNPAETSQRLKSISKVYASMRPHVSGACYINYCDLDLQEWAIRYWGANYTRLRQIKSQYDPLNVLRHAQSVPPI
jgi:FAD binding domain/Berberine and berberine like